MSKKSIKELRKEVRKELKALGEQERLDQLKLENELRKKYHVFSYDLENLDEIINQGNYLVNTIERLNQKIKKCAEFVNYLFNMYSISRDYNDLHEINIQEIKNIHKKLFNGKLLTNENIDIPEMLECLKKRSNDHTKRLKYFKDDLIFHESFYSKKSFDKNGKLIKDKHKKKFSKEEIEDF